MKWLNEKKSRQYLVALLILLTGIGLSSLILWQPWTIQRYTVTFLDADGQVLQTQRVREGNGAKPPSLQKDGMIFKGWDKDINAVSADVETDPILLEIHEEKNVIYADTVYGQTGKTVSVTPRIGGVVDCCSFVIEMGYDAEAFELLKAEPILEGLTVETETDGLLVLSWSSEIPLEENTTLVAIELRCLLNEGSYGTMIPFLTREIYRLEQGERVYTDSTAYDTKLYLYK